MKDNSILNKVRELLGMEVKLAERRRRIIMKLGYALCQRRASMIETPASSV